MSGLKQPSKLKQCICVHDGPSPFPCPSTSVFYPYTCYQLEVFTIIRLRTRLRIRQYFSRYVSQDGWYFCHIDVIFSVVLFILEKNLINIQL
jgi:hypothetical protein